MKIRINKLQHQLISRFRSKDRNRAALNHIGVIEGHIYATDGKRCVKIKMNAPVPDGTYRFFFDGDYFLFKEEDLFPNAKQIMPDFSELVEVCRIIPRKNDGLLMMNCILEVFENTARRINLSFLTDLDVGHEYAVLTKKGEEKKHDAYLYLRCESEDRLYGKPEIVLLPFNH